MDINNEKDMLFLSPENLSDYFDGLKETETYYPNGSDTFVSHVPNTPLAWNQMYFSGEKYGTRIPLPAPDFDDDSVVDTVEREHGMMFSFPDTEHRQMLTLPMRGKAYVDVCARAGFANAQALMGKQSKLAWDRRAKIVNCGLHDYTTGQFFVLYRYGKVLAVCSNKYKYLEQTALYQATLDVLKKVHPEAAFNSGRASLDYVLFDFLFHDEESDEAFRMTLNHMFAEANIQYQIAKLHSGLRLTTGDTGLASVATTSFVDIAFEGRLDTLRIPCGRRHALKHEGDVSESDVLKNVQKVLTQSAQEFEDRLEQLGLMDIEDIGLVLDYLGSRYSNELPRKYMSDVIAKKNGVSGNGVDIILSLNEVAMKFLQEKKDEVPLGAMLDLFERLTSLMWADFVAIEAKAKEESK